MHPHDDTEHALLEQTLNRVSDAIFALDCDWRFTYLNPQAEVLLRQPAQELLERSVWEVFPEAVGAIFDEQYHLAMAEQRPVTFEAYYKPLHTHFAVRAYPSAEGLTVIFQEITERKQAERALRESEERYRLLAETMLQGVVYQDAAGRIISMNPAAERILGKSPDEFLGETSVSVEHHTIHEDGAPFPGQEHPSMLALRTGQIVRNVVMGVYNPRLRGYRWININAVPLFRSGDAAPYQVYTVFEDITERKQTEEEREHLLAEVERRYTELDTIFSAIVDPLIAFDAEGTVIKANPATEMTLGRAPVGMHYAEIARLLAMRRPDGVLIHEMEIPASRALRGEPDLPPFCSKYRSRSLW